jgi:hypothetical protein
MPAPGTVENAPPAGVDDFVEPCRAGVQGGEQSQSLQDGSLLATDLFDAEIGRIDGVAVDEGHVVAGTRQRDRRQRARQAAADDGDLGVDGEARSIRLVCRAAGHSEYLSNA